MTHSPVQKGDFSAESRSEHEAWLSVVAELTNAGVDMDAESSDQLTKALILWGERLAQLRARQSPQLRDICLERALTYKPTTRKGKADGRKSKRKPAYKKA